MPRRARGWAPGPAASCAATSLGRSRPRNLLRLPVPRTSDLRSHGVRGAFGQLPSADCALA
eukprot:13174229-Alexandrium_andersonii.AAC.1